VSYQNRKPTSIFGAIKANFYWRFLRSRVASAGVQGCEVMRLPDGTLFTLPTARQRADNPAAIPFPPKGLVVFGMPANVVGFGADNGPGDDINDELTNPVNAELPTLPHDEAIASLPHTD
jgi:hypothetical protein